MRDPALEQEGEFHWGRFGFLVADLFTALAVLFLVANTIGHIPPPPPPPPPIVVVPTNTPTICGLDPHHVATYLLTVSNAPGLRSGDTAAESAFAAQVRGKLTSYTSKTAGLAEVWGGSLNGSRDVTDGENLANGAIAGLRLLAGQHFIFSTQRTIFQPFWDGTIGSNQVKLLIFFYNVSSGAPCSQ